MKIKVIILSMISTLVLGSTLAQDVEYDDMYFSKKDRAKLSASRPERVTLTETKKKAIEDSQEDSDVNPTDSYSARNVNPEFTSRSASQTAQIDNEDYFVNNYRLNTQNNFNNWNSNFNNWYNNPWYNSAYYGGMSNNYNPYGGGWNNSYNNGYYDSWGNPYYDPYRSGWSNRLSYSWGNSWNSGWGMNYGCGSSSWNNYWGSSYGYSPYGGGGWNNYSPRIIVVNERDRGVVYGKRNSRSSNIVNNDDNGNRIIRGYSNNGSGSRSDNGGRVATNSKRQSDYYDRTWRNDSRVNTNSSSTGFSNDSGRTSTWDNGSNNNNSRSTWRESNTTIDRVPTRSSGNNGGSRSSGGSNQNSGSRSSSRGRGN